MAKATQWPLDGPGAWILQASWCHNEAWLDAILTAVARLMWAKPRAAALNYRICRLAPGLYGSPNGRFTVTFLTVQASRAAGRQFPRPFKTGFPCRSSRIFLPVGTSGWISGSPACRFAQIMTADGPPAVGAASSDCR
jgi:hypothetical protein